LRASGRHELMLEADRAGGWTVNSASEPKADGCVRSIWKRPHSPMRFPSTDSGSKSASMPMRRRRNCLPGDVDQVADGRNRL
jgi:hypothetical protein